MPEDYDDADEPITGQGVRETIERLMADHVPPTDTTEDDPDPRRYVDDLGRSWHNASTLEQRTESHIRGRLAKGDVMFYPASAFDWGPIRDFAGDCSTFIYCDWKQTPNDFDHAMLQVPQQNPALNCLRCNYAEARPFNPYALFAGDPVDPLRFATQEDFERLRGRYEAEQDGAREAWGRWIPALSVVDGMARPIEIVYLCAEGVSAYIGLFRAQKRTPRVLCIKNCGDGFGGNWTAFYRWNEPLGRVVEVSLREDGLAPEYVVTEREDFDWPWHPEGRQRYRLHPH